MKSAVRIRRVCVGPIHRTEGFSLIEVLIALLILAFGLLGLAFLQVMSVRYTQSAQHRTMATNLAYEVLDMMRSNSVAARQFGYVSNADFPVAVPPTGCVRGTSGAYSDNINRWKCEIVSSLPNGSASINFDDVALTVTVAVSWTDDVGREDTADVNAPNKTTTFEVSTRL